MNYRKIYASQIDELWKLQKTYKVEIEEDEPGERECARLAAAIEKGHITFYGAWNDDTLIGCCSITAGFFNLRLCTERSVCGFLYLPGV